MKHIWSFFSWTACNTLSGPCARTSTKRRVLRVKMGIHSMMWACFWAILESGQQGSINCSRTDARRFTWVSDMSDILRPDWSSCDNSKQAGLRFFLPLLSGPVSTREGLAGISRETWYDPVLRVHFIKGKMTQKKTFYFPFYTYSVSTQVVT